MGWLNRTLSILGIDSADAVPSHRHYGAPLHL